MSGVIVYSATDVDALEPPPSIHTPGDRTRAPTASGPRTGAAHDAQDSLVAALGDQLLAAWLRENASKLRLPLLTSCSEPGNTPAPNDGTSETRI